MIHFTHTDFSTSLPLKILYISAVLRVKMNEHG